MDAEKNPQFNDKEVSLILKQAARLQQKQNKKQNPNPDLSLRELQRIASEAGLDPELIGKAAAEVKSRREGKKIFSAPKILGGPLSLTLKKRLPFQTSTAAIEDLIPIIQEITGIHGSYSQIGNTFTWQTQTGQIGQSFQVILSTRNGKTDIQVQSHSGQIAGGLIGGLTGGIGGGLGFGLGMAIGIEVLGSLLFAVCFPVGMILGSFLLGRGIYSLISKSNRRMQQKLIDKISAQLKEDAEESPGEAK